MSAFLKIILFGQLGCFACTPANEMGAYLLARLIVTEINQSLRATSSFPMTSEKRIAECNTIARSFYFFEVFSVSLLQITIRTELSLLDVACLLAQDKSNRNRWLLWHIGVD